MNLKSLWKSKESLDLELKQAEELELYKKNKQVAQNLLLTKLTDEYILSTEVPDEEKDVFVNLYELFSTGAVYNYKDKFNYQGDIYEVIQPHTSQEDWKPNEVPALYKLVYQLSTSDGVDVIPEWKQPLGGHDSYNTGDLVSYNKKVWESSVDGNVWPPGVYGWTEY